MKELMLVYMIGTTCPEYQFENKTKTWTEMDEKALSRGKYLCYTKFDKGCLKKFIKRKELTYWVICKRGEQ